MSSDLEAWMLEQLQQAAIREQLSRQTGIPYKPAAFVPQPVPESIIINMVRNGLAWQKQADSDHLEEDTKT